MTSGCMVIVRQPEIFGHLGRVTIPVTVFGHSNSSTCFFSVKIEYPNFWMVHTKKIAKKISGPPNLVL